MLEFAARTLALVCLAAVGNAQGTCLTRAQFALLGTPDAHEDFSGFAADTPFELPPSAVTTSVGMLAAIGGTGFRNTVDVPPLDFADNNGTAHASCLVNFFEPNVNPETFLVLQLAQSTRAFGVDLYGASTFERVDVHFLSGMTLLDVCSVPAGSRAFLGYENAACFDRVEFRSRMLISGALGQGFGMDDLAVFDCAGPIGAPSTTCTPVANSTGAIGTTTANGSTRADHRLVTLVAAGLPANQFGYFIAARTPANFSPPGSNGFVCVGPGGIGRYNAPGQVMSGPTFQLAVGALPVPTSPQRTILAGDTWYWQCWHRDIPAGMQQNNFTTAVGVRFF